MADITGRKDRMNPASTFNINSSLGSYHSASASRCIRPPSRITSLFHRTSIPHQPSYKCRSGPWRIIWPGYDTASISTAPATKVGAAWVYGKRVDISFRSVLPPRCIVVTIVTQAVDPPAPATLKRNERANVEVSTIG